MDKTKESKLIPKNELSPIRKKKLNNEIQAAIRLLRKNVEPLEIADKFIHNIFELMKNGISQNYPELSEGEIILKVRDRLSLKRKINTLRMRGKNLG